MQKTIPNNLKKYKSFSAFLGGGKVILIFLLFSLSLSSCSIWDSGGFGFGGDDEESPEITDGQRPIYAREDAFDIFSDVPRAIQNGIVVFEEGTLLFTVDADLGIHVEDNSNPSSPRRLVFIQIPGVRTGSASGDRLFANNFEDLLGIDISDLDNVTVVSRQEDFYDSPAAFPPNFTGFFECYDESRGPLLGWEQATIFRPQCRI
jgi:hypothetical protein